MGPETMVAVNGVELCVQEIGSGPAILLVGGAAMSMDWWDDQFCELLAERGRRVVRFDTRDTGRSTTWPPGKPGYTFADMRQDVVALIEHLNLAPVHLAGISMGGAMAQEFTLRRPDLVSALTLMATSSIGDHPPGLPGMDDRVKTAPPPPDWTDRDAYITYSTALHRLYAGPAGQDETRLRTLSARVFDRTRDIEASETNHWALLEIDTDETGPRNVHDIAVPTTVLHGTDDPMFPLPHGRALADAIPGATLVTLEGVGHETPPPPVWEQAADAMVS